jgi:hypothetical protein
MWKPEQRPSVRVQRVLRGEVRLQDEDASIQSVCSFYIYEGARELLAIPNKEARRRALQKVPELIRPHIEKEAWRIYDQSRSR